MVVVGNFRNRAELRKKPRRAFHYNARIVTGGDPPAIVCSIADISESGARLALESETELPDEFVLLLTPKGTPRRNCRVIWRDGLASGSSSPRKKSTNNPVATAFTGLIVAPRRRRQAGRTAALFAVQLAAADIWRYGDVAIGARGAHGRFRWRCIACSLGPHWPSPLPDAA